DLIGGADQLVFAILGQIAHIQHAKVFIGDQHADGLTVLIFGFRRNLIGVAVRIGRAGVAERQVEHVAAGGKHLDVDSLHRDGATRFHAQVLALSAYGRVFVVQNLRVLALLDAAAVID